MRGLHSDLHMQEGQGQHHWGFPVRKEFLFLLCGNGSQYLPEQELQWWGNRQVSLPYLLDLASTDNTKFFPTLQLYQTLKLRLFVLHHCNLHTGLGHSLQDSLSCASSCSPIAIVLSKHLVQCVLDTINAGICRSGLGGGSCTALWWPTSA